MKMFLSRPKLCKHVFGRLAMVLVLVSLAVAPVGLAAQDIFGRISGTITDATGAVIPRASVTITNEETRLSRTLTADDRGFYVAPELAAGGYSVTATPQACKTANEIRND